MCGFVGLWRGEPSSEDQLRQMARAMADRLRRRGPDGRGEWVEGLSGLALGHRRLAVVELSEAGAQPMLDSSGRFVVAYNGEIYNHLELRRDLPSIRWRGTSDTETLVEGVARWGAEKFFRRANGMFAAAIWDRRDKCLTLVRDRLGIKPLYVGRTSQGLFFGSDLAALGAIVDPAELRVDARALAEYFRFGCVPGGHCIFEGFEKMTPGSIWTFSEGSAAPERRSFWELDEPETIEREGRDDLASVERALLESVEARMLADVPVGAFLSGGIDSSLITALMTEVATKQVQTFSIGFEDPRFDESSHARAVASHLGTAHSERILQPHEALDLVPELPEMFSEPFADSSQLPTALVSRFAREQVTVVLTGDGGDEVFGGYNRHVYGDLVWRLSQAVPFRATSARVLHELAARLDGSSMERALSKVIRLPANKMEKVARTLGSGTVDEFHRTLSSIWREPESLLLEPPKDAPSAERRVERDDIARTFMRWDLEGYLHDDILAKVDRASMHYSLEARVPFLDHRTISVARSIATEEHVRGRQGKRLLRSLLDKRVPRELTDRPKAGFGVPVGSWIRGPLRDWAESLISTDGLTASNLQPAVVQDVWSRHLRGEPRDYEMWAVLMYRAWWQRTFEGSPVRPG